MKVMIAGLLHETNTFSPVALARFCPNGRDLLQGEQAIGRYRGPETFVGGFIEMAEAANAEFELPLAAHAPPSAPVSRDAFETMSGMIINCLEASHFDGLLLALHGAMVVDGFDDGEGELLRRIRVGPGLGRAALLRRRPGPPARRGTLTPSQSSGPTGWSAIVTNVISHGCELLSNSCTNRSVARASASEGQRAQSSADIEVHRGSQSVAGVRYRANAKTRI